MAKCSVLLLGCSVLASAYDGQTDVAKNLNDMISTGSNGVYTGGKGVIVRTPDFLSGSSTNVLPATMWVNDIIAPSQMYPNGNPMCPNSGWDGYESTTWCQCTGVGGDAGPWEYAVAGVVIGTALSTGMAYYDDLQSNTWGWGVFYAADSNSVDQRCRYLPDYQGWDCPGYWVDSSGTVVSDSSKAGAGYFPAGNPYAYSEWGGGSGCHWDSGTSLIDQADATAGNGQNIVGDYSCQCNYIFNDDWSHWVETWINNNQQKSGFGWRGWFGGGKAPQWAMDTTICWVNNPRDMINLQNTLYLQRANWNNQLMPQSSWGGGTAQDRIYWGWNEVPMDATFMNTASNWDSVIIKLPADICQRGDYGIWDTADCLSSDAQNQLESDMSSLVNSGALVPGQQHVADRPGSYILFVREYMSPQASGNWYRYFFCAQWQSPNAVYTIYYDEPNSKDTTGRCYIAS